MRRRSFLPLTIGMCVLLPSAVAQLNTDSTIVSDADLLALPEYCQARIMKAHPRRELWAQRLGKEGFVHLHHYCFGLTYLRRATTRGDATQRRFLAQRAVANFDYVLKRWQPGFELYVEAQAGRMRAKSMLR